MTTRRILAGTAVTALLVLGPASGALAAETPSPSGSGSASGSASASVEAEPAPATSTPAASTPAATTPKTETKTETKKPAGAPATGFGDAAGSENRALAGAGAAAMLAGIVGAAVALRRRGSQI